MILIDNDNYEVRQTEEKGRGVFVTSGISKGTVVADYLGTVWDLDDPSMPEYLELYEMWLYGNLAILPDMDLPGAYLINHSCNPNCAMYPYMGHIVIYALRDIEAGEELTFNYHFCPDTEGLPECRCKDVNCRGDWRVTEEECKKYCDFVEMVVKPYVDSGEIKVGTKLKKLSEYPIIND